MNNSSIPKLVDLLPIPTRTHTYTYSKPVKKEPNPVEVLDKRDSLTYEIRAWFAEYGESDSDMCAIVDELAERLIREGFIGFD